MADEMLTRPAFLAHMKAFEERFNTRMPVQFEETRVLIRLLLEGLDALRETTAHGFAEISRANRDKRPDSHAATVLAG